MDDNLKSSLDENMQYINDTFKDCDDIVKRKFTVENNDLYVVYTDNIVDGETIENFILTNLLARKEIVVEDGNDKLKMLMEKSIGVAELSDAKTFKEVFDAILLGDTAVLMDGCSYALIASTKGWPSRGVSKAETEVVVQGPKDAFFEVGSQNVVLIRRRIRDTRLKVKRMRIGVRSKTDVAIMYVDDIARPQIIKETLRKLENINIDGIFDCGNIEQMIEKNWLSPFPQLQLTERPDKAASALLEGRIVVVVDNTPLVILIPATLSVFFQAAEDYYERWEIMSFVRFIRYCAAFVAVSLPGIYIALTLFHPSMLPTALALKIAQARETIPFPTVVEVLIMELSFELLREAGIRLPSPVSSTIGIVGGIIIGQAAVEAGIVGPIVVILGAITGISTFVIPNNSLVSGIRLSKYLVIALSSVFGLYGFLLSMLILLIHLCQMESFGIPYMFPFCSSNVNDYSDYKDTVFRLPLFKMTKRPIFASSKNIIRMSKKNRDKGE